MQDESTPMVVEDELPGDLIYVNGIEFKGFHGILPDEQREGRKYRVDLVVEWPLEKAGKSDKIVDTIDYRDLSRRVLEINEKHRCNLIERLAVLIADELIASTRATACSVTVHKFAVDVPAQSVAVKILRRRTGSTGGRVGF